MKQLMMLLISALTCYPAIGQLSLSQAEFDRTIDSISLSYRKKIKQVTRRKLQTRKYYGQLSSNFIKDSANQYPHTNTADVTITSSLIHQTSLNADGFAIMVCHEFGHHLGNGPKQNTKLTSWSSVEGQADYWATNHCMRKIFQKEDNERNLQDKVIPVSIKEGCQTAFPEESEVKDYFLCLRTSMAALNLADYFNEFFTRDRPISPESRDPLVVNKTLIKYGSHQCRLDTFLAGARCNHRSINFDPVEKNCLTGPGKRPSCWYKEEARPRFSAIPSPPPFPPLNAKVTQIVFQLNSVQKRALRKSCPY